VQFAKSTLQSLEMKKGISFFAKNFYRILPRFWQAAQQLEPLQSSMPEYYFQIPKFKR
jgi:hypothetical protein